MKRQFSTLPYRVDYAEDDTFVKRYLRQASGLKIVLCVQILIYSVFFIGLTYFEWLPSNGTFLISMMCFFGVNLVMGYVWLLDQQQSAWLRTLEIRLEELRQEVRDNQDSPSADHEPGT